MPNECAPSRVSWKFLLAALCICLTACGQRLTRPCPPPSPPAVDCALGLAPEIPAAPQDWMREGPAWAVQMLAVLTAERELRAGERECIEALRTRGVIR